MYNISLKVNIHDATTPATIIYKDVVIKVTDVTLAGAISQIVSMMGLSNPTQIEIVTIGYIQQVLTNSEE